MVSSSARKRGDRRREQLLAALAAPRTRSASLQDLATELGWGVRLVHYHLTVLQGTGRVIRDPGSRGYRVVLGVGAE